METKVELRRNSIRSDMPTASRPPLPHACCPLRLVVVERDFLRGAGGGVDVVYSQRSEHLEALLEILERGQSIRIRLPETHHSCSAVHGRLPQIGEHAARGSQGVGLQKIIEKRVGDLNLRDPCAGPSFQTSLQFAPADVFCAWRGSSFRQRRRRARRSTPRAR